MERIYESRWFHLILILVLTASVLLAYSNTFNASFQFDDLTIIIDNEAIRSLRNLPGILSGQRGITMASFAVNFALGGMDVTGYHIVNIGIHILNAVAAYFLVFGIFREGDEARAKKIAAFSSLIFALHPVQTQSVTYLIQRMESLSALFYLLGLLVFIKAAKAASAIKKVFLFSAVCLLYVLGFYSKETAFTFPAVVFLYDFYFISGGNVRRVLPRWPVYLALAGLLVFLAIHDIVPISGFGDLGKESARSEVQTPGAPTVPGLKTGQTGGELRQAEDALAALRRERYVTTGFSLRDLGPKDYLYTQFNVLVYYISLLLVPVNQNVDYDFPVARSLFKAPAAHDGTVLNIPMLPPVVSLGILLAIIALGVYLFLALRRGANANEKKGGIDGLAASFFIFWFFIILSPTSSFIPIRDVIFEHRLYLASLGFSVIFVLCVDRFFSYVFAKK